jgi:membrane protein
MQLLLPEPESRWRALARAFHPTLRYWMQTEVHVYGFSIAANVLLSFFPFLIVILSVGRHLLGWKGIVSAISLVLDDYFPGNSAQYGTLAEFMLRNLTVVVESRRSLQVVSILLLLFTANGIFEPMEVALNRAWGIARNRSFLKNQLVSLGLIFICGTLALLSTALTGMNLRRLAGSPLARETAVVFFKMAALPVSILMLFLIYWLLPNAKIRWRAVLPQAILVGIALEALKYVNLLTWPLLSRKLEAEYGPFFRSATIVLWSFLGAMVILAGGEWAARRARAASS